MAYVTFLPPYAPLDRAAWLLHEQGYAVLQSRDVAQWLGASLDELHGLSVFWSDLPPDDFLKDGGRYRYRRHACFVVDETQLQQVPHRAHWQPVQYNALHGGMRRWFAPMPAALVASPLWQRLVRSLAAMCQEAQHAAAQRWFVEAHQFRISTQGGIGRPTPEGAHRDGVDLVAVFLLGREAIKGGETRIFEAAGPSGQRFTLTEPWSVLLLDDNRMIHETTPIQPEAGLGWRDTLVLTCRRNGFLGD